MERIIEFSPAFDKRDEDPHKSYGVHGVEIRFVLKGDEGAVQFLLFTRWQLNHVEEQFKKDHQTGKINPRTYEVLTNPLPADLGYHSYTPHHEGQEPVHDSCPYLNNKPCYYDGSGLNAVEVFGVLKVKGSDGVWEHLENYYKETFLSEKVA